MAESRTQASIAPGLCEDRPSAGPTAVGTATTPGGMLGLDELMPWAAGLRRRWWLVLGLPALVVIVSVSTAGQRAQVYQARLSFAVDIPRQAVVVGSDEGTPAKLGEALIDDLSRVISGDVFAEAVARQLPDDIDVRPGEIASSLSATDRHRIADVTVTRELPAGVPEERRAAVEKELVAIAEAVVTELRQNGGQWFAMLGEDGVRLTIVDRPKVAALPAPLRYRLELPLRLALAFLVSSGLAVALHLFDPRLYDETEAVRCARAPVVGRIPRSG